MWDFEKYRNNTALITDERTYSYGNLDSIQKEMSGYIDSRRIMFIICTNTMESILGYVSAVRNKTVPVLLSKALPEEKYVELIKIYRPEYIWCNSSFNIDAIIKGLTDFEKLYGYEKYILYKVYREEETPEELYEELALLLATSGSTGSPKYVRISYENLISNTQSIVNYLNISSDDVTITSLPMNYTYGLSVVNTYLYVGASIVVTEDSVIKRAFWDKVSKYRVTSISGVPYTYDILKKINIDKIDLPHLQVLTQAGGKLSDDTRRYLISYCGRKNKKLVIMYGQTEATARISYMPYDMLKDKEESVGKSIPGGNIWIVDEEGERVKECCVEGEIIYKGDNVTLGYGYSREDLAKGDERGKILYTGDYGYMDKEGYLFITGRKDRYAKLFGNRIDLAYVEEQIRERYDVVCRCSIRKEQICIIYSSQMCDKGIEAYVSKLLNVPIMNIVLEFH